jgi:meso-butanediol dehydrogenase / (S,S)-butanediol dehydrogenase / diacetyl reductase
MDPSGAVVLVTGASCGIGAAAAAAFDRAGARVAVAGRRRDALERVAADMRDALVVAADLARVEEAETMVRRTVERFGRIDVLINNAAVKRVLRSDRLRAEDLREAMAVNLIAPMAATRAASVAMRRQGGGHVINVGMPGWVVGAPLLAPYAASKAALSSWTRALQAELEETEIRVTEYLPGYVEGGATVESEIGDFGAELWSDPRQSRLARWLAPVQSPEEIAEQLVDCVRRPRPTMYSSPAVRFGAALGLFTRLRIHLGSRNAAALRARTGTSMFTPDAPPPGEAPAATAIAGEPAPAATRPAGGAAKASRKKAKAATGKSKPAAAKPAAARSPVAKKKAAAAAAERKVSGAAAEKAPPRGAKKKASGRGAKKASLLSPEAAARVRAAAERAAASARGDAADSGSDDGESSRSRQRKDGERE